MLSTLDLVVTNKGNVIDATTTRNPCDHLYLELGYVYSVIISISKTVRNLYNKGEYQCFNTELLTFNWDHDAFDDEVMWSFFHAKYVHLSNKHVPTQCCSGPSSGSY